MPYCLARNTISAQRIGCLLADGDNLHIGHQLQQHFGKFHAHIQLRRGRRAVSQQLALLMRMPREDVLKDDVKGRHAVMLQRAPYHGIRGLVKALRPLGCIELFAGRLTCALILPLAQHAFGLYVLMLA